MSSAGLKQSKSLDLVFGRTKAACKYKRGQDVLVVYEQVFWKFGGKTGWVSCLFVSQGVFSPFHMCFLNLL